MSVSTGLFTTLGKVLNSSTDGFIKRALVGAGLSIGSSAVVLTIIQSLISRMSSNLSLAGDVTGLIGLSGLDVALSVMIGALIARATLASMSIALKPSK